MSQRARKSRHGALILAVSLPFCAGCLELGLGGTPEASDDSSEEADEPPRRRSSSDAESSATCNDWKVSYCRGIEKCEAFSDRSECENDVGYLVCLEGAPYGRCHDEIEAALTVGDCPSLPGSECTPAEIADRTGPYAACQALHEEQCEWQFFCGLTYSLEDCEADLAVADPCENYLAVWPGIEPCLQELPKLGCTDPVPDVCLGILRK